MDAAELARLIQELEDRVERLRALYEQYFMGIERIEPLILRKEVDRRLWALRREQIRNTGTRFKLQTVVQRYNTYQQYWQRVVREIENGTYQRDLTRAAQRFGEAAVTNTALGRRRQKMFEKGMARQAERDNRRRTASGAPEAAGSAPPGASSRFPSAPDDVDDVELTIDDSEMAAPSERPSAPASAAHATRSSLPAPKAPPRPGGPPRPVPSLGAPSVQSAAKPPVVATRAASATSAQAAGAPVAARIGAPPVAGARPPSLPRPANPPRAAAAPPAAIPPVTAPPPVAAPPAPTAPAAALPTAAAPTTPRAAPAPPRPGPPLPRPAPAAAKSPAEDNDGLSASRMRQIYGAYVEAKRQAHESTAAITYDKVAANLRETAKQLRDKHQARAVDFEVVMKNGKPILKPVVKA